MPGEALRSRTAAKVPVLIGTTGDDLPVLFPPRDNPLSFFGADAAAAKAVYFAGAATPLEAIKKIAVDITMHEPARFVARQMTAAGQPAWLYRFDYVAESLRLKGTSAARLAIAGDRLELFDATGMRLAVFAAGSRTSVPSPSSELAGTSWQLVRFQGSDDTTLTPDDRAKYTIEFVAGGRLTARIDCNRGRGTWKSSGSNQLQFGPLALTRAKCPAGSLHDQIVKQWGNIRSYVVRDGHLFLALWQTAASTSSCRWSRRPSKMDRKPSSACSRCCEQPISTIGEGFTRRIRGWTRGGFRLANRRLPAVTFFSTSRRTEVRTKERR
jgi:heat shock protein HslJ